jgi:hypothetical protein
MRYLGGKYLGDMEDVLLYMHFLMMESFLLKKEL